MARYRFRVPVCLIQVLPPLLFAYYHPSEDRFFYFYFSGSPVSNNRCVQPVIESTVLSFPSIHSGYVTTSFSQSELASPDFCFSFHALGQATLNESRRPYDIRVPRFGASFAINGSGHCLQRVSRQIAILLLYREKITTMMMIGSEITYGSQGYSSSAHAARAHASVTRGRPSC